VTAMPRVLILGASGQLGTELQRSFAGYGEIIAVTRANLDLAHLDQTRTLIRKINPNILLNAAAYTAVDRAESDQERAITINAEMPHVLAEETQRIGSLLVHYSTDYVFDGEKREPWTESDIPVPLNVYGASKLAGEEAIRKIGGKYLIFRTSWVYGPHASNFLLTMLHLAHQRDRISVVNDQYGAPTTSIELANTTHMILSGIMAGQFGAAEHWAGLYHMTCSGSTSWCGFACEIFARAGTLLEGKTPEVIPITSADYPTPAKRPRNSVLSNARLHERFGIQLAPWPVALDAVLQLLRSTNSSSSQSS
jgi:dTDP-4-dehydrorhamnose reductase